MTQKSPLNTLIEIEEKNTDDAAKRLGNAIRAHEETQKKLALLVQYRDDYDARFQAGAAKGLSITQYHNFQSFIRKLDSAIDGQKQVVKDAENRIQMARKLWQDHERKRLSYGTLQTRAEVSLQNKETKRDQKAMDEHASRSFFYKR
ncbi:flagellar export protein FliJ [Undibacterium sp. TJN25]|uniref:flagellar export protein FliJ n=1 Tax=Undibacterium sp. TJN25 TaxID=3413056 RepID=UPI003BF1698B